MGKETGREKATAKDWAETQSLARRQGQEAEAQEGRRQ
jgi:hypothetical protein